MINSVNTLEFLKPKLLTMDKFNSTTTTTRILPPPSPLTQATRTFVTFTTHHHHHKNTIDPQQQQQQHLIKQHTFLAAEEVQQQQLEQQQQSRQERVKVQHLENHTKLQNNNCWNNLRTLYQLSASDGGGGVNNNKNNSTTISKDREMMINSKIRENLNATTTGTTVINNDDEVDVDVEHFTTTITNIQNKSAFNLNLDNKIRNYNNNINNNSIYGNINKSFTETNNNNLVNNFYSKQHYNGLKQSPPPPIANQMIVMMPQQRTEDQDQAYRHIESVHNYAKLKSYEDDDNDQSPNDSRNSSYIDDDDEEDDEDDDDADHNNNDDDDDYEDSLDPVDAALADDLDADYEDIFNRRRLQKLSTSSDGALTSKFVGSGRIRKSLQFLNTMKVVPKIQTTKVKNHVNDVDGDDDDLHIDVDVETVETQAITAPAAVTDSIVLNNHVLVESSSVKPDHHARRPMNAFLIFCKRHRAIVKERYKNLENRAITKILGDWWASLETGDKICFTTLAQQNKDAFFSANPNFKWYKLPAPPLRTLATRPANVTGQQEYDDVSEYNAAAAAAETISNNTRSSSSVSNSNINNNNNYFKLADEAQMGDLSQLMQDKSKTNQKQCAALQQALGETSQFISAHITGNVEILEDKHQLLKRRFYSENSFSSNSSEEDAQQPKKKTARTCKGKRYQELINSGQIATAMKKPKTSLRLLNDGGNNNLNNMDEGKQNFTSLNTNNTSISNNNNNNSNNLLCQKRSVSESEHHNMASYDLSSFDLEERIKELPALDLDDYLQRKRNTKKKKKFTTTGKKRGRGSSHNNTNNRNISNSTSQTATKQLVSSNIVDNSINRGDHHHHNRIQLQQQQQQKQTAAVGSQKRKARKESITRRDISAIEQEVASLLPLTINGCCYFQEAPPPKLAAINYNKSFEKDIVGNTTIAITAATTTTTLNLTSPIIPLQNSSLTSPPTASTTITTVGDNLNSNTLNDNISSSTSDLLILAEVAANRTELKH